VLAARAAGCREDDEFIAAHIQHSAGLLLDRSRLLAEAVGSGQAAVAALSYRLTDGSAHLVTARGLAAPTADPSPTASESRQRT
jgi:carbonic anhydrase